MGAPVRSGQYYLSSYEIRRSWTSIYSRAQVLFCSMVSGFDNVHIRANLPRLEQAIKYGNSAGDRCVLSFSLADVLFDWLNGQYLASIPVLLPFTPSLRNSTCLNIVRTYTAFVCQILILPSNHSQWTHHGCGRGMSCSPQSAITESCLFSASVTSNSWLQARSNSS